MKGMTTYVWFYPDREGEFIFHCTEFCGIGHSRMDGMLSIVSQEAYQVFLEEEDEDE